MKRETRRIGMNNVGWAGETSDFFSTLLFDDVAYEIVQSRIGNLDFDELPCCG